MDSWNFYCEKLTNWRIYAIDDEIRRRHCL